MKGGRVGENSGSEFSLEGAIVGSTAALAASVLGISTMLSKYPDNLPYPPEIKTKEDMENYRKLFSKSLKRKFITNIVLCNALSLSSIIFIDRGL